MSDARALVGPRGVRGGAGPSASGERGPAEATARPARGAGRASPSSPACDRALIDADAAVDEAATAGLAIDRIETEVY